MKKSNWFQIYLVPGIVFQSMVIAGGYGTGRELVEYFLQFGPKAGLLGLLGVSMAVWSGLCALTFCFARRFAAYDYKSLFSRLLGRAWPVYEACYFAMILLILAVIASASGETLRALFNLPYGIGVALMMGAVALLVYAGAQAIERFLSGWSFVLYGVYILFVVLCLTRFGSSAVQAISEPIQGSGWAMGGLKYAWYNLGIIPAVLFTVRHQQNDKITVVEGRVTNATAVYA